MDSKEQLENLARLRSKTETHFSEVQRSVVYFISSELNVTLTFINLPRYSYRHGRFEDGRRQLAAAREAYRSLHSFLPETTLTPEQRVKIEGNLVEIDSSLKALNASFYLRRGFEH